MCRVPRVADAVVAMLERVQGMGVADDVVRRLFYDTFAAGKSADEAVATLARVWRGVPVHPMLDFAGEAQRGSDSEERVDQHANMFHTTIDRAQESVADAEAFVVAKPSALLPNAAQPAAWRDSGAVAAMAHRMHDLAAHAQARGVKLLVDAEQAYTLDPTRRVVRELQREFNQGGKAVVYGTVQAYLCGARSHVREDLADARMSGYVAGVKLVRGAYLEEERGRALSLNDLSPCFASLEETHRSYQDNADALLDASAAKHAHVIFATHNRESVLHAVEGMRVRGMLGAACSGSAQTAVGHHPVAFAQLLSMADEVTHAIATDRLLQDSGVRAYKYLTFGRPTDCALFLARRASENAKAEWVSRDIRAAISELLARAGLAKRDDGL